MPSAAVHCYRLCLIMALLSSFTAAGFVLFFVCLVAPISIMSTATSASAVAAPIAPGDKPGTVIHTTEAAGAAPAIDIEVDFYAGGVMRLRARPKSTAGKAAAFQVTDVVVGKKLPGPRKADIEPEERVNTAPPGTYYCGTVTATDGGKIPACHVTSPCGSTHMFVAVRALQEGATAPVVEFQYKHKTRGTLSQGTLVPRPEGPQGELVFPLAAALYGIPERAVDLALKAGKSYRLYNLDVFKYELDATGGVYGTIPFLMAHGGSADTNSKPTTGVLWLNAGDSTVETKLNAGSPTAEEGKNGWYSKWTSEGGLPDVFFFPGATPREVQRQHATVVGPTMLPPLFSLGYHQCRWNYRSEEDTLEVDHGFEAHDIPYDVLWLDIEHTDGKRYFTWDKHNFPNPKRMIDKVAAKGRKMVTITDPHIKVDSNYYVHKEASAKNFYVKSEGGNSDFEGHCWPGTSSWVDFYNSEARAWYATLFHYDRYEGSTPDLYSWLDMNEMSVFNSHEVTMPKNNVHRHADGTSVLHSALHNMYGFYHTMAAYDGHLLRNSIAPYKQKRPFILTRSFFSGSQRYAAMWTGDNMARWDHLEKSLPMLLALSLSNYIFVGADVGGFFDNPDAQLMTRWYQAGALYPFFRGHAHLETKRREPWLFGDDTTRRIRDAIILRYTMLPYFYTQFFLAHDEGDIVMRPLFYHFPEMVGEQRAFMVGPALLSCPVTKENAETHEVPLPASASWYSYPSGQPATAGTIPVTIDSNPVYLRGGHIIATRQRTRRSASATVNDPLTLYVAVDNSGASSAAVGSFYHDDGDSFEYRDGGMFLLQDFAFDAVKKQLAGSPAAKAPGSGRLASPAYAAQKKHIVVEKIVIFGLKGAGEIKKASFAAASGQQQQRQSEMVLTHDADLNTLTISKPMVSVSDEWTISLE